MAEHRAWLILVLFAVAVAAISALSPVGGGVATGVILMLVLWLRPTVGLEALAFAVLAIRPALDIFSEKGVGIGPFTATPPVVFGVAVLVGAMALSLRRLEQGKRFWPDPEVRRAHLWLFATYGIGLISGTRLYGSGGAAEGLRELVRVGSFVVSMLLVFWWVSDGADRYRRGMVYLVLGVMPPVLMALWQWVTGTGYLETEGLNRLEGTMSHPNSFGEYLVPLVLVCISGFMVRERANRWLRLVLAAGLTVLIIESASRTALLMLISGLVVLPILQARQVGTGLPRRMAIVIGLLAVLSVLVFGRTVRERFAGVAINSEIIEAARGGQSENSLGWRLINWSILLNLGMEHPVAGHGTGMTTVLNPLVNRANGVPYNAHNDFVRFFFETGLLGTLCYTIYAILLCRWLLRRARVLDPPRAAIALGLSAALLTLFFVTVGASELSLNTVVLYQVYGMLGLLMGHPSLSQGQGYRGSSQSTPGGGT